MLRFGPRLLFATVPLMFAPSAFAQDRSLPAQFQSFTPRITTGEIIIGKSDARSAKQALNRTLDALSGYLGQRPMVLGAVTDKVDQELQANLAWSRGQEPMAGLILISAGGGDATVGLFFDRAKTLPASGAILSQLLKEKLGPPAVNWRPQTVGGGRATLKLPERWDVSYVNDMISAKGPQGMVDLGIWCQVYTPQAAGNLFGIRPPVVAPYGDPAGAVRDILPPLAAMGGVNIRNLRVVEQTPVPWPTGKGAYLVYEADVAALGKVEKYRTLALVLMSPVGDGTWIYYSSSVTAPADQFATNLPVLLEIYKSWKVSDQVFQDRLAKALQSMRETHEIIRSVNANRQRVMARACDDWSEYIRGTRIVMDNQTGRYRDISNLDPQRLVDNLNHREGYDRFRVVPLKDLNNP